MACRLQISLDVVDGIRFLHSQGLVHRDIKLKNVLVRKRLVAVLRAVFHMPHSPRIASQHYRSRAVGPREPREDHRLGLLQAGGDDERLDSWHADPHGAGAVLWALRRVGGVYAFGILFWFVCAGHVRLPANFEQCMNKDMLWNAVKFGKLYSDQIISRVSRTRTVRSGYYVRLPLHRSAARAVAAVLAGVLGADAELLASGSRAAATSRY